MNYLFEHALHFLDENISDDINRLKRNIDGIERSLDELDAKYNKTKTSYESGEYLNSERQRIAADLKNPLLPPNMKAELRRELSQLPIKIRDDLNRLTANYDKNRKNLIDKLETAQKNLEDLNSNYDTITAKETAAKNEVDRLLSSTKEDLRQEIADNTRYFNEYDGKEDYATFYYLLNKLTTIFNNGYKESGLRNIINFLDILRRKITTGRAKDRDKFVDFDEIISVINDNRTQIENNRYDNTIITNIITGIDRRKQTQNRKDAYGETEQAKNARAKAEFKKRLTEIQNALNAKARGKYLVTTTATGDAGNVLIVDKQNKLQYTLSVVEQATLSTATTSDVVRTILGYFNKLNAIVEKGELTEADEFYHKEDTFLLFDKNTMGVNGKISVFQKGIKEVSQYILHYIQLENNTESECISAGDHLFYNKIENDGEYISVSANIEARAILADKAKVKDIRRQAELRDLGVKKTKKKFTKTDIREMQTLYKNDKKLHVFFALYLNPEDESKETRKYVPLGVYEMYGVDEKTETEPETVNYVLKSRTIPLDPVNIKESFSNAEIAEMLDEAFDVIAEHGYGVAKNKSTNFDDIVQARMIAERNGYRVKKIR